MGIVKNRAKNALKMAALRCKIKKISREGHSPLPRPHQWWGLGFS